MGRLSFSIQSTPLLPDLIRFKNAFQFPFHIGKNALNIVQHGDKFELRINNQSFTHLYDNGNFVWLTKLERTKRNFNYEERDQNDPYQAKDYAKHYEYVYLLIIWN